MEEGQFWPLHMNSKLETIYRVIYLYIYLQLLILSLNFALFQQDQKVLKGKLQLRSIFEGFGIFSPLETPLYLH